ncbi:DUF5677 domain-containing protein [Tellurirhabdus bombi]|uniref:DUF5677 domain-containing protein n=1 Tax=Tellurirhabdus bombi TaxID=2907205 RepID=UPI001F1C7FD3|nr:DUF5677 domain-containing protein [Tellurirhabdus bombi]
MINPVDTLFPKKIEDEKTREALEEYSKILHEMVCMGTHLLEGSLLKTKGVYEEYVAPLLFKRILEIIDSISILVKEGSIRSCEILLRSFVETGFSLEFLLEQNVDYRSKCYVVVDIYSKISRLKKELQQHPDTANANLNYKNNSFLYNDTPELFDKEKSKELLKYYEEKLLEPGYDEINKIYLIKCSNKPYSGKVKWYYLDSNVNNLSQLAIQLKKFDMYDLIYRQYSSPTHGDDILNHDLRLSEGNIHVAPLRNYATAPYTANFVLTLGILYFDLFMASGLCRPINYYNRWKQLFIPNSIQKLSQGVR